MKPRDLYQIPRAPRLPLRAPIAFRKFNATGWQRGQTLNTSRSGVLFVCPVSAGIEGQIEFVINLSRGMMRGPGVALLPDLHCQGRVVRSTRGSEGEVVIAARVRRQTIRKARSFFVTT